MTLKALLLVLAAALVTGLSSCVVPYDSHDHGRGHKHHKDRGHGHGNGHDHHDDDHRGSRRW